MLEGLSEAELALLVKQHRDATMGRLLESVLHALRNPLNSIHTSTQLLAEGGELQALRDKLLPVMARCSSTMVGMLDAIDLNRIETAAERPVDLHAALASCLGVLSLASRYLEYHPSGVSEPAWVEASSEVLWTVLLSTLEICVHSGAKNLWIRSIHEGDVRVLEIEHDGGSASEDDSENKKGASLELELSGVLLSRYGEGELQSHRREPKGSRIVLTLRHSPPRSNEQDPLRR